MQLISKARRTLPNHQAIMVVGMACERIELENKPSWQTTCTSLSRATVCFDWPSLYKLSHVLFFSCPSLQDWNILPISWNVALQYKRVVSHFVYISRGKPFEHSSNADNYTSSRGSKFCNLSRQIWLSRISDVVHYSTQWLTEFEELCGRVILSSSIFVVPQRKRVVSNLASSYASWALQGRCNTS